MACLVTNPLLSTLGSPIGVSVNSNTSVSSCLSLRTKYPAITYFTSFLEVEPGWRIAYVETGNPDGLPVVFIHGGPGGKFYDSDLCWFDPDKYRIIAFDQRGSGRSDPSPATSSIQAEAYSTINIQTFASDMEALRKHLNIDRWLIFGGSWGTTLSLYYGQEYPEHTHGLVLRGIFLASHRENDRFYSAEALTKELGDKWDPKSLQSMYEYVEENNIFVERTPQGILDAFYELVLVRNDFKAMHLWSEFEEYVDNPSPDKLAQMLKLPLSAEEVNPSIRAHAIFEILFFRSLPNELDLLDLARLEKIKEIPVYMVQGVQDTVCPKEVAMLLEDKITSIGGKVSLKLIEGEKHTPQTPGMTDALITITDDFQPQ